jgi:hypothetical protein
MAQVAVRAMGIVVRTLVVPVADHASSEHQQGDKRQRNHEQANYLWLGHLPGLNQDVYTVPILS